MHRLLSETAQVAVETSVEPLGAPSILMGSLWISILLVTLIAIGVMCDEYLVPSLVVICNHYRIPEGAAGATIFALASAGMDIFFSCIETALGEPSVGLAYVIGAGIIAFGLIPPAVVYYAPQKPLRLEPWPILRDSIFCVLAFGTLLLSLSDDTVGTAEAAAMVLLYIVYWVVVFVPVCLFGGSAGDLEDQEAANVAAVPSSGTADGDGDGGGGGDDPPRRSTSTHHSNPAPWRASLDDDDLDVMDVPLFDAMANDFQYDVDEIDEVNARSPHHEHEIVPGPMDLVLMPFRVLYLHIFPRVHERYDKLESIGAGSIPANPSGKCWGLERDSMAMHGLVVALCMLYMLLLTVLVVHVADYMAESLELTPDFSAAVLLPFIYNFPDLWASVVMARKGLGDGSLANATGAQVANVLLGCGLPFLLFTLNHGPVSVTSASCDPSLKYGLVVVGFTFVAGSMASKVRKCDWKLLGEEAKVTFGAWQAYFQLFVYFAVMVVIVARTVR